jgi:hypothetical protein
MKRLLVLLLGCAGTPACSDSSGSGSQPETQKTVSMDAEAPGDTWTGFAQGFFESYCVGCHGAGNANRDYTLREQVVRDAELIRCGVAVDKQTGCADWPPPSQFPIGSGPHPNDDERNRIVAWLEAGAPE